jgi:hypothetical protein
MGQVSHFLGIEFNWKYHSDDHLSVCLTQQTFVESLLDSLGLSSSSCSTYTTPYRSGLAIDSIKHQDMSSEDRDKLRLAYQSLVGSLNLLAHTTCLNSSTVVFLLAQHHNTLSPGHYDAAIYATKYLANTEAFISQVQSALPWNHFYSFLFSNQLLSMSDANWGPQDASHTKLP